MKPYDGSLAQLVERHVYTVDVIGSIPVGPTTENPVILVYLARVAGFFAFLCLSHPRCSLGEWNTYWYA